MNPDRLVLSRGTPLGCVVFGVPFLVLSLFVVTGEAVVPGVLMCLAATALVFGRRWMVLDRKEGVLIDGFGVEVMWWSRRRPISDISHVEIHETVVRGEKGHTTTYVDVSLKVKGDSFRVVRTRIWEAAVAEAEKVAAFLRVPIQDKILKVTRPWQELNISLRERLAQGPVQGPARPEGAKASVAEGPDGALCISIPRPRHHHYLVLVVVALLFWSLPVSLMAGAWFGLIPVVLLLPMWIKTAFGYSADVSVDGRGLTVTARGLFFGRTRRFPVAELEELAILSNDYNAVVSEVCPVALVARSDRESARFGYGLSVEEVRWLRGLILEKLAAAELPAHRLPVPEPSHRRVPHFAVAGAAAGAVAAAVWGGPLDACVAAPFLQYVLNAGALIGGTIGFGIDAGRLRRGLAPWALLLGAAWAAALIVWLGDGRFGGVISEPYYDEKAMLRMQPAERPWIFWGGWLPAGVALSVIATMAVGLNVGVAIQMLRRPGV